MVAEEAQQKEHSPCTRVMLGPQSAFGWLQQPPGKGAHTDLRGCPVGIWLLSLTSRLLGHVEFLDCTRSTLSSGSGGKVQPRSVGMAWLADLSFWGPVVEKVDVKPSPLNKLCTVQLILNFSLLLLPSLLHSGLASSFQ